MEQRLIDANALIKDIHGEFDEVLVWDECGDTTADEIEKIVNHQPTVDAKPVRHGKWIPDKTGNSYWICTKCGFPSEASGAFALYHYCPNCGCRMDEE